MKWLGRILLAVGGGALLLSSPCMHVRAEQGDFEGDNVTVWQDTNTVPITASGSFYMAISTRTDTLPSPEYDNYVECNCSISVPGDHDVDIDSHDFHVQIGSESEAINTHGQQFFSFKFCWEENGGGGHSARNLYMYNNMVAHPDFLAESRNGGSSTEAFGSTFTNLYVTVFDADTNTQIGYVNLLDEARKGYYAYEKIQKVNGRTRDEVQAMYGMFSTCTMAELSNGDYIQHPESFHFTETDKFRSVWCHHDGGSWADNGEWYGEQSFDRCAGEVCVPLPSGTEHVYAKISAYDGTYSSDGAYSYLSLVVPKFFKVGSARHTVTLEKDSGVASVSGAGVYDADTNAEISATFNTGYEFDKWETSTTGFSNSTSNPYTFSVSADVTYKAISKAKKYTLKFDYNKPSVTSSVMSGNGTSSKTVTYDSNIGTLPSPALTGYIFNGWTLKGSGMTSDAIWKHDEDNLTAYAQWTPIKYRVGYGKGSSDK